MLDNDTKTCFTEILKNINAQEFSADASNCNC